MSGLTLVLWSSGKALCCDVTVTMSSGWLVQPPESQARPQSLPLPARKRNTPILMVVIFLNRSPLTHLAYSTHQLASSCVISVGKFLSTRGRQRNELSVSKMVGARATLQCHITSRQFTCFWLHRQIVRTQFYPVSVIFKTPSGSYLRRV